MTGDPQNRFPFDDGPQDTDVPAPRINEQQAPAPMADFGEPTAEAAPAAPERMGEVRDADLAQAHDAMAGEQQDAAQDDRLAHAVARSRTIDPDQGVNSTRSLDDVRDAYAAEQGARAESLDDIDRGAEADAFAMPGAAPAAEVHDDATQAAQHEPAEQDDFEGEPTAAMDPEQLAALRAEHSGRDREDDELDGIDDTADAAYAPKPAAAPQAETEGEPTVADDLRAEAVAEHEQQDAVATDETVADGSHAGVVAGTAAGGAAAIAVAAAAHRNHDGLDDADAVEGPDTHEEHRRRTVEIDRTRSDRAAAHRDDGTAFAPLSVQEDDEPLEKPAKRSNRGFGILIAFFSTLILGAAYTAVIALYRRLYTPQDDLMGTVMSFIPSAEFWMPVAVFFLFGILWALIVNRAGWWSYIIGGLLAGLATAAAYPFGYLVQQGINTGTWNFGAFQDALLKPEHLAPILIAFILGREIFTWVGGFAALRGRRLTKKHRTATSDYERALADREAARIEAKRDVADSEVQAR